MISELLYIYISDLRYGIGGVLFDIGAPTYISDLQYDIGGVLFEIRLPIYYIGCAIYKYDVLYIH